MRASAPGKLVISGAYSVLWGAPAIVTAVDRVVIADSGRVAELVTPEVACAIGARTAPWCDASALRSGDRKLGLGSSAAILVASLGVLELEQASGMSDAELARAVFEPALVAHRKAQGGGSGIDVAASAFGGTLQCRMRGEGLDVNRFSLPAEVGIDAYAETCSSVTSGMVSAVRRWVAQAPASGDLLMGALRDAAEKTVGAAGAAAFLEGLRAQAMLLAQIGDASGVPIVSAVVRSIAEAAWSDGLVVMPSGAGGGDIVLCVGGRDVRRQWRGVLEGAGMERVPLEVGAAGVRRV